MLVSGGQIGVAFAYAFLPAFFAAWYLLAKKIKDQQTISHLRVLLTSLSVPLMLMLDARVLMLSVLLIFPMYGYLVILVKNKVQLLQKLLLCILFSAVFTFLIHAHWIIPAFFVESIALPQNYLSSAAADFFSFTRFAHPLTWSHPNYPDNIFGKVNEVNGLAFIFPILAFLAIKLKPTKLVAYLSALALIFAFLAKGTNEPFGELYLWLFQNVPGMNLFRDSTKFFIPLSFCYSYLIATSTERLRSIVIPADVADTRKSAGIHGRYITNVKMDSVLQRNDTLVSISFIMLLIVVWFPTFSHQIKGTLQYRTYPASFQQLENQLKADQSFGRVLWVPSREIYGYASLNHPAVNLEDLIREPNCLQIFCQQFPSYPDNHIFSRTDLSNEIAQRMSIFTQADTEKYFQKLAINYVVLSPDYDQTIYTLDYKHDPSIYEEYQSYLDSSFILKPLTDINNLAVYKVHNSGVFMSNLTTGEEVSYTKINPTQYQINWSGGQGVLLVSQSHDQRWQIRDTKNNVLAVSQATEENLTSFDMNFPPGTYNLVFAGQQYADLGWIISQTTILLIFISLVTMYLMQRKPHVKK